MEFSHINRRKKLIEPQAGLTLVELLVAMAIAAFMGIVIYELFLSSMNDWTRASVNSNLVADANITLTRLGQDIRQARNPNSKSKAVLVGSDNSNMDVYHYDENNDTYQRIAYLVEEVSENNFRLKRGVVETDDPGNEENPPYGTISNWQILLEGINSKAIFYDITGNTSSDRRLIEVSLSMCDKKNTPPKYTNYQIKTSFMSRSQQLSAISGGGGSSEIRVTNITVTPTTVNGISKNGTQFSAAAQVSPGNATNQNVSWSKNRDWISIDNANSASINVTIAATSSWSSRNGTLTATSQDGGFTATITVNQNGPWSW